MATLEEIEIVDTHIHLSHSYSGGLPNEWQPDEDEAFHRDFSELDYRAAVNRSGLRVAGAVFVECFNRPAMDEARWVLDMVDDPSSIVRTTRSDQLIAVAQSCQISGRIQQ